MVGRQIPYCIVDVFTKSPFLGNPLAVIRDATALSDAEMQSIATEFGFSESSFILPSNTKDCAARVRIFTPTTEIPFAGHPNIGTAYVLASEDTVAMSLAGERFVLDELGGKVSVSIEYENNLPTGARIVAPQALEILGDCNIELMANCLGLGSDQLPGDGVGPCVASVGLPFAFVEVKNLDALSKIAVSIPHFQQAKVAGPETVDGFAICAYVRLKESSTGIDLRSRVFSPLGTPIEDPATGSASGALAALLAPPDRSFDYRVTIEQGVEMGRASQITVNMNADSDRPEIVGNCVTISTGVIHL